MRDPADFWDPRWKLWIAEADEHREQRRIVLDGRESFGETSWPPRGVGIAVGVIELPITLERILNQNSEKLKMLSETEKAVCRATGVSEEQFAHAKTNRAVSPQAKAGFVPVHSGDDGADSDDGLSQCCRGGSMDHLKGHRDAIAAEIASRDGSGVQVRFAK